MANLYICIQAEHAIGIGQFPANKKRSFLTNKPNNLLQTPNEISRKMRVCPLPAKDVLLSPQGSNISKLAATLANLKVTRLNVSQGSKIIHKIALHMELLSSILQRQETIAVMFYTELYEV